VEHHDGPIPLQGIPPIAEIPILELHEDSGPELMEAGFFHQSLTPDDFLRAVMRILQSKS